MSDDRRRVEYVPVDPKAYGLGLLLGWLYNNRRGVGQGCGLLVILGLVVAGISWVVGAGSNLLRYGTIDEEAGKARVGATALAVQQTDVATTSATQQALAAQGLERIQELRRQGLALVVDTPLYEFDGPQSIRISSLAFAPDGLRVYLETTQPLSDHIIQASCLAWRGRQEGPGIAPRSWGWDEAIDEGLAILPLMAQASTRLQGEATLYRGMVLFPYTLFPADPDELDGAGTRPDYATYYFMLGCNARVQIPMLNLTAADSWAAADIVDIYTLDLRAREQGEGANSSMQLSCLEHMPGTDVVRLSLAFILDEGSDGFVLAAPDEVYIEIAGERIAPADWGGAYNGGYHADWGAREEITEMYCMDCGAAKPPNPAWLEFPGAWDKIARAGCFSFRYGTSYYFPEICLDE